jgi:hypothetical protein
MEDDPMRLPITRLTPLECVLWAGAGLAWTAGGGVPGASPLGLARHEVGVVRIGAIRICHANTLDPDASGPQVAAIGQDGVR